MWRAERGLAEYYECSVELIVEIFCCEVVSAGSPLVTSCEILLFMLMLLYVYSSAVMATMPCEYLRYLCVCLLYVHE